MYSKQDPTREQSPAPILWDEALLARHDVRGPRYTSYPGAHLFTERFSTSKYEQVLENMADSNEPLSLYVHIPFCENICYYCGCNKIVTRDRSKAQTYLAYLEKEIAMLASKVSSRREIRSLHFGGGTPTFLRPAELTELMYQLSRCFNFADADNREFSIEIDPRTIDVNMLGLIKGLGFNRLSFGVQDFDPQVQKAINRIQTVSEVEELTQEARDFGFTSISYDLIYGLPNQNQTTMAATIATVIKLQPDRIALYNYAHLPELFSSQRSIDRMALPSAQEKLSLLCLAANTLQNNGYRYIGMDHFVREDDELNIALSQGRVSRNFQGYSVSYAADTLALGVSGISSVQTIYAQNHKSLDDYYAALDRGELPIAKGIALNQDDCIRRAVINEIICSLKLDISALEQTYDLQFDDYFSASKAGLLQAERDGLLSFNDSLIQLTETGRLFMRNICMLFDNHLNDVEGRFSRTL